MERLLSQLGTSWTDVAVVVVAAVAIYVWVIAAVRVVGLRSFSKLSAFDFAMTVAIGSIIASAATGSVPLAGALVAVAVLFAAQYVVARLRRATSFEELVDNRPLLLMHRGEILEEHLTAARLTHEDLRAKLRAANVLRLDEVSAVVLETTGDVSVLHGTQRLDPALLAGVRCGPVDPAAPE